jgi:hypothetical protein
MTDMCFLESVYSQTVCVGKILGTRPNHSSCNCVLGSTQPVTEMSTRNLPWGGGGGKGRLARKADKSHCRL